MGECKTLKRKFSLLLTLMLISVLILAGCGGNSGNSSQSSSDSKGTSNDGETIKLSFAFFTTETTFLGQMVQYWADQIEERTNGRVDIEIYYGGTLLDATNMYDGVRQKVADGGLTVLQYEPGKYPLVELAELIPYEGGEVASQVAYDLAQEYPIEALSDLKVVAVFANDQNYLFTNHKVQSIDDLKGKQYRVAGAYMDLIQRFGAAGVGMSQAEQAEALQTGVIDGTVTERALTKDAQLAELVDYLVDKQLYVSTFVGVLNTDTWNSLPEDVQKVFEEVGAELPAYAGKKLDERTGENLEWAKENHGLEIITLSEEDSKKWDEIVNQYLEERIENLEKEGQPAREYYERALELIEQYSKK